MNNKINNNNNNNKCFTDASIQFKLETAVNCMYRHVFGVVARVTFSNAIRYVECILSIDID